MHLVCTCLLFEARTLILLRGVGIATVVLLQAVGLQIKCLLVEWHTHCKKTDCKKLGKARSWEHGG